MKKYEITRQLFKALLNHTYTAFTIPFSNDLRCEVIPEYPQEDSDKSYLGTIPVQVKIIEKDSLLQETRLTVQFVQRKEIPGLEDGEWGYAFAIRGPKTELVYRAMQVALYQYPENATVHLYSDLDSKTGNKSFLPQMLSWLEQYDDLWKPWGGQLLPSQQFAFLTYDTISQTILQDKDDVLRSALLIAILKAALKKEIQLPLPLQYKETAPTREPLVWKIAPGENASHWEEALTKGEIFVGWDEMGSLQQYGSREELMNKYKKVYQPEQEPVRNVFTLWSFYHDIQPGDIVIANRGWRQLVGIGKVTGDYEYREYEERFPNRRKVEWIITENIGFDTNVFKTPTLTPVHNDRLTVIQNEVVKNVANGEEKWKQLFGVYEESIQQEDTYIDDIVRFMKSRQFTFSPAFVARFVTSLQSKPFLILSGMSGTGKTKIAQLFAEYMIRGKNGRGAAGKNRDADNLAFLSVRPDWLDHRGLLGMYNPLTEQYEATPLLRIMLRAKENPEQPYFVILDEMNLAKVEYYFSDFLSCLESRRISDSGDVLQEAVQLHNCHDLEKAVTIVDGNHKRYEVPPSMEIPLNLYFIGTVNIDETTYMFSPKVLDRANVLECNRVEMRKYWMEESEEHDYVHTSTVEEKNEWFTSGGEYHLSLYSKEYRQPEWRPILNGAYQELSELHKLLEGEGYAFGYRVIDEIMTYVLFSSYYEYSSIRGALDAQIVQKVLPKLHGNRKQLETLLTKLLRFAMGDDVQAELLTEEEKDVVEYETFYRYPLSGKKIYSMYTQLMKTGYCSFIS